jgi:DNA-binding response OmpR family regulator
MQGLILDPPALAEAHAHLIRRSASVALRMANEARVDVNTPTRILIVDDDELLCDSLVEQFSISGEFAARAVKTAAAGIAALKADLFDLVILDVGLPDMDGREACKAMRRNGYAGPVIMLTGQSSDSDTILGLESGANDYVAKPFKFNVLVARIRAQLRQHEHSEAAVFRIGPYTFRPSQKLLIRDDRKVRLTEKEASILKYLYRSSEKVVPRDVLLREVWGYSAEATTHTVETHIYRLRQKIERDPSRAEILVTEESGYRLRP